MTDILKGKVAVITGAADGMGRAIAELFAREGAHVVATDIHGDKLSLAHGQNSNITTVATDITAAGAPEQLVSAAVAKGGLDILVNAAGIFQFVGLEELTLEQYDRMMDVNLNAPFRLCLRAIPELKKSGAGRIVNIASTNALRARAGMGAYTISKHGIAGLTISLAVELAKYGITANSINPGTILTGITRELMTEAGRRKDMEGQGLMNRLGTVDEIAQAALYLVGPNSGFTTGHGLAVDGGFLVKYPDSLV
ncbi:SDR family NAD(P)-dependent oxidoreductase [Agrobacterium sp. NPDC090283]|uniref:SDR family NAD(P)-dependent oxidoreductase n=1 Tax=Agrobacterium sp. NPDC090283 TaxID=3363920 RepID=UPI00383A5060